MHEFDIRAILDTLPPDYRQPLTHEPVAGGQSLVRLYRLTYEWGTAILKGPLQAREEAFYREVALSFAHQSIAIPRILGLGESDGDTWIMREDLPTLLPYSRWVADLAVIAALRQIHTLPTTFRIPHAFVPTWQDIATLYQATLPAQTVDELARLIARHEHIFTPTGVVAGDPNPTNWGIRADDTLVLFDWDRIGYGVPAHDLAITVPSLGWPTIFRQVAAAYYAAEPTVSTRTIDQLAHDMAISKLQTTIDYINTPQIAAENRQFVLALFPSWVEMIAQMDAAYHAQ